VSSVGSDRGQHPEEIRGVQPPLSGAVTRDKMREAASVARPIKLLLVEG
jgi:hypothetical protein